MIPLLDDTSSFLHIRKCVWRVIKFYHDVCIYIESEVYLRNWIWQLQFHTITYHRLYLCVWLNSFTCELDLKIVVRLFRQQPSSASTRTTYNSTKMALAALAAACHIDPHALAIHCAPTATMYGCTLYPVISPFFV